MRTGQTPGIELFQYRVLEQRVAIWSKGLECTFSSPQGESPEYDNGTADESLCEANEPPASSYRNRHDRRGDRCMDANWL